MRYLKIRKCIKENDMEELMLQFRKLEYDKYLKCIEYLKEKEGIDYNKWKELLSEEQLEEFNYLGTSTRVLDDLAKKLDKKLSIKDRANMKASDS